MIVKVEKETCIGCGACVSVASEVFEIDDEGKAFVKEGKIDEEKAKEGADTCPVQAIKITENEDEEDEEE